MGALSSYLLVLMVVRPMHDVHSDRVDAAKGDEGVADLLPLGGLGCEESRRWHRRANGREGWGVAHGSHGGARRFVKMNVSLRRFQKIGERPGAGRVAGGGEGRRWRAPIACSIECPLIIRAPAGRARARRRKEASMVGGLWPPYCQLGQVAATPSISRALITFTYLGRARGGARPLPYSTSLPHLP